MPADLTGIDNVGEFFSQHYLDELLVADLAELRARWRDTPGTAPDAALRALGQEFARAHAEASKLSQERSLWDCSHPLQVRIAEGLGYTYQSGAYLHLPDRQIVPVLSLIERHSDPYLVVVEGRFSTEAEAALDVGLFGDLPPAARAEGLTFPRQNGTLGGIVSQLFALEAPPRWVLLLSGAEAFLAERARWGRGQYLRFDLAEILGRRDATAIALTAALLARESLAPGDGAPLHDRLDEESHKHAHGVSKDLKFAAREAVELIGNEWVHHQRSVGKKALYGERVARELTEECLVFLYRLLFLFYAEARSDELQSLPMNAEEYARGYSLEALRELEQVPLTTSEARDGSFFHESVERLFRLVNEGHRSHQAELRAKEEAFVERGFSLDGLGSPLFDPKRTPRLSAIRFRNATLQRVIRLLSLSQEGRRGRGRSAYGRGRISYAQLGINQLGAVYEGLLSYTGFFAKETLYEVHPAGERSVDETQQAFFVPESDLARYSEDELSFEGRDDAHTRRKYAPGTFIFRLAGRGRETSASYYTPEVLTRCLVKYSLKELLQDKTADEILKLRICEPAMGSGAFLVEAVDQLADAYLERKQRDVAQSIPADRYGFEKQRVKTHLAVHGAYGVDLNPMAARLAGVSLWLATMHRGQEVPWFEPRLAVGNSLVGARLEVYFAADLETDEPLAKELSKVLKKAGDSADLEAELEKRFVLFEKTAPDAVAALRRVRDEHRRGGDDESDGEDRDDESDGEDRDDESDDGAADARPEKTEAECRAELVKALKKSAKDFKLPRHHRKPPLRVPAADVVAGKRPPGSIYHFLLPDDGMSPFDKDKAVAALVPEHVEALKRWRKKLGAIYAKADIERLARLSDRVDVLFRQLTEQRTRVLRDTRGVTPVFGQPEPDRPRYRSVEDKQKLLRALQAKGGAYARLLAVMDLWAALWAWPLEHAVRLPTRDAWWSEVERLLDVEGEAPRSLEQQLDLLTEPAAPSDDDETAEETDTSAALAAIAAEVSARLRPLHWELEFPEAFVDGGGFDLTVGNPPWIKLQWNEQGILGDIDPRVVLDGLSASEVAKRRKSILRERWLDAYLQEFGRIEGEKAFVSAAALYPLLVGVQANAYKCFVVRSWAIASRNGVAGLIHQDGMFDDPRGGRLREATFRRLRWVFRFKNIDPKMFKDIANQRQYVLTVAGEEREVIAFQLMANLYVPATIDASIAHDGAGNVPGIKDDVGQFEKRGHRSRLVEVTKDELALFASLFDKPGTPALEARLPIVHSREVLSVLEKLTAYPHKLAHAPAVFTNKMWHEGDRQRDGTIRRETRFPKDASEWIISGPHFYVGNPFSKTPRENCSSNRDYDVIDLEAISDEYLPRTNYVPACSPGEYEARLPVFDGHACTKFYRHVHRRMIALTGERGLISCVVPPGPAHVDGAYTVVIPDQSGLIRWHAATLSLPLDFFLRVSGTTNLWRASVIRFPAPAPTVIAAALAARALRLNCLTHHYAEFWNRNWCDGDVTGCAWSVSDLRLSDWAAPSAPWSHSVALRNAFERRQALLEIDALAALELGLTIDELCTIYRTQFPVLRDYENNTWYDKNGRIVFTNNRGLPGVGLERNDFEAWQACLRSGDPLPEDFDPKHLEPPFDHRDREEDMRVAYEFFKARLS